MRWPLITLFQCMCTAVYVALNSYMYYSHNSDEYQLLEEKFQEASKTIESLSCVLKEKYFILHFDL